MFNLPTSFENSIRSPVFDNHLSLASTGREHKIRAELAWVNETPDPNKCGCRNLRCCEETGRKPGDCASPVATKFSRQWSFMLLRPFWDQCGHIVAQLVVHARRKSHFDCRLPILNSTERT